MKNAPLIVSTGLLFLSAMPLMAEEASPARSWDAAAELGFVKTSGNSETEILNAKVKGSTTVDEWKHTLGLEALNSSSANNRSAERYLAAGQSDRSISDRSYLLGVATWENDRFSGFDYQATVAFGYGYKVIQEDDMALSLELAPGYRVTEYVVGNKEEDAILRAAEKFSWKVSKTSTLDQLLSAETGKHNTITRFGVSLTSQVAGDLSMRVGYALKHSSDVPDGAQQTDTETSVTLVYKI